MCIRDRVEEEDDQEERCAGGARCAGAVRLCGPGVSFLRVVPESVFPPQHARRRGGEICRSVFPPRKPQGPEGEKTTQQRGKTTTAEGKK
eukprot:6524155-Pyramimonas_sp.AAC.1